MEVMEICAAPTVWGIFLRRRPQGLRAWANVSRTSGAWRRAASFRTGRRDPLKRKIDGFWGGGLRRIALAGVGAGMVRESLSRPFGTRGIFA
jgi:hypothetical protein